MGDPFIIPVRVIIIAVYTQDMGYSFGGGPAWSAFNKHTMHIQQVLGSSLALPFFVALQPADAGALPATSTGPGSAEGAGGHRLATNCQSL